MVDIDTRILQNKAIESIPRSFVIGKYFIITLQQLLIVKDGYIEKKHSIDLIDSFYTFNVFSDVYAHSLGVDLRTCCKYNYTYWTLQP